MIFLDPKTDVAFKKLFSNQKKKEILISFLNSILQKKEDEIITDVTIIDPHNMPENIYSRLSIVDVRCTDQKGTNYIVEMQLVDQKDFAARSQYYASLALARQLGKREKYKQLVPVVLVGVVCFNLFEGKDYLSHHYILDAKTHEHTLKHLEFHFIELPKFKKNLDSLKDVADKWIYLLKYADTLNKVPKEFSKNEPLQEAMEVLERSNWSLEDLGAYEKDLDGWRVYQSGLETAEEKGMARGMARGMEKGMEKGIEKGMEEGKLESSLQIAKKMLMKKMSIETIIEVTGLSKEQVATIKKDKAVKTVKE